MVCGWEAGGGRGVLKEVGRGGGGRGEGCDRSSKEPRQGERERERKCWVICKTRVARKRHQKKRMVVKEKRGKC